MAVLPVATLTRTFVRCYSHRGPRSPYSRLGEAGIMAYLSCAFVLPFVVPWRETQRAKKDGSYSTRPPLDLRYCPSLKV
ncbi:hypothetical protein EV356DRAFT_496919 [Viridothelium virens]|uniref:Uncharacterized protein n=1 Tax=Viridothelium virens TaxID=1048519 RepID=A0A6A6GTL6_VIRVR|nr:hypothetical protein EV356DRAFT_496919 [Viridothelium virens]